MPMPRSSMLTLMRDRRRRLARRDRKTADGWA
eukprot:CAMPEP_0118988722 /NCGR_PEP_ID=MMETSP1173-20130426/46720_1 /TAXON_ID=1034831 /ORGANISM="Rhizochromulina marina cf, Strain CCMP1243" /LENGTH=31 /DNA_ID= /DNA_START= /DNA_END= /DNA_ORIENTATION=